MESQYRKEDGPRDIIGAKRKASDWERVFRYCEIEAEAKRKEGRERERREGVSKDEKERQREIERSFEKREEE